MPRCRIRFGFTLLLGTALAAPLMVSAAPSFDCRRASHAIEKLICSDAKLSALDTQMAELFGDAMRLTTGSRRQELLSEQRGWIKNRNDCAKRSEPRRRCVLEHYTQRNARLEESLNEDSHSAADDPANAIRYRCDDHREIVATFVRRQPASVRLERDGERWTLPQVVSGSGARYADGKVVFWSKGEEALFERGDGSVNCRPER